MEIEFRTGKREVPDWMGQRMRSLDTRVMTYEEAVDAVNRGLLDDHVYRAQQSLVREHFGTHRGQR